MMFGQSGTLRYMRNPTTVSEISFVRGRYGGLPGTQESGVFYGVDILIQTRTNPPFPVVAQYYKSSGAWSAVT